MLCDFAERLNRAMEEQQIGPGAVSEAARVSVETVAYWREGKMLPGPEEIRALSLLTGRSAAFFLGLAEPAPATIERIDKEGLLEISRGKAQPKEAAKILVVDDDPQEAWTIARIFHMGRLKLLEPAAFTDSIEDALRLLDEIHPDGVVMRSFVQGRLTTPILEKMAFRQGEARPRAVVISPKLTSSVWKACYLAGADAVVDLSSEQYMHSMAQALLQLYHVERGTITVPGVGVSYRRSIQKMNKEGTWENITEKEFYWTYVGRLAQEARKEKGISIPKMSGLLTISIHELNEFENGNDMYHQKYCLKKYTEALELDMGKVIGYSDADELYEKLCQFPELFETFYNVYIPDKNTAGRVRIRHRKIRGEKSYGRSPKN